MSEEESRRISMRGPGCLTIVRGGQVGLSYRVGDKKMVIGRGESADVVVIADGISRKHAELVRNDEGAVELVDLGSRNGTFVNRVRVQTTVLVDGDRIRVGDVDFDFRYEKPDDRATVDLAAKKVPQGTDCVDPSDSVALRFVSTMSNLAQVHFSGGRYRDALATYERARTTLEGAKTTPVEQLSAALVGIGRCHLELGAPHKATAPLQRALDLLQESGASEGQLARPRFALARALGRDEERSAELIQAARAGLGTQPSDQQLHAEIEAWMNEAEKD